MSQQLFHMSFGFEWLVKGLVGGLVGAGIMKETRWSGGEGLFKAP